MSSGANDAICKLMAENGNIKKLLCELLPEMESRLAGLKTLWPGPDTNFIVRRNELYIYKIREFIKDFNNGGT